jgi:diadenosine tetraphosphate (Ap4A) HIT family hydrolase
VVLDLAEARVLLPDRPHVAPREGGHLVVAPRAHVAERRQMTGAEMVSVDLLTMLAADALDVVFGAEWQNYQENGNWYRDPSAGHAHVHVYGRRRDAVDQPFGEALQFPPYRERENWRVASPDTEQVIQLGALLESHLDRYDVMRKLIDAAARFDRKRVD